MRSTPAQGDRRRGFAATAPERAQGEAGGAGSRERRVQRAHRRGWRPNQIGRQRRQSVEADFAQTFAAPRPAWAAPPQLRLLRLRRQRPRLNRAAEEGGELAPPVSVTPPSLYGQQPAGSNGT